MDLKWALAFNEGEGSFFIAITHNRTGWYLRPRFSVSLHMDDRPVLEIMKDLFESYGIKTILQDDKPHSRQRSDETILTIRSVQQCRKLAELLKYMKWYSRKYRDFLMWEYALQLFEEIKARPHAPGLKVWTDQDIFDMVFLRKHMNLYKKKPRSNRNEVEILVWNLRPSKRILFFLASLDKLVTEMAIRL